MIRLEPFTEKDFAQLIYWSGSEELLMQYAGPSFSFPLTESQLAATLSDHKRKAYTIVLPEKGETIGHAEIYFPNTTRAHFCRVLIADKTQRGKGLGLATMRRLLETAFAIEGIEEASLNVYDWNTAAIKCYNNAGFTVHSRSAGVVNINGQVWTTLSMRLTRLHWQQLQAELNNETD